MQKDNVNKNYNATKAHRAKDAHIDTCGVARAGSLRSSSSAYALAESERRERPRRESNERLIYVFMKNKTVAPVHLLFENRVTIGARPSAVRCSCTEPTSASTLAELSSGEH